LIERASRGECSPRRSLRAAPWTPRLPLRRACRTRRAGANGAAWGRGASSRSSRPSWHIVPAPWSLVRPRRTRGPPRPARRRWRGGLRERNPALVLVEPARERQLRGVQRTARAEIARAAERVVELDVELEHVAEIVCAGEPEAAVRRGRHFVVTHILTE